MKERPKFDSYTIRPVTETEPGIFGECNKDDSNIIYWSVYGILNNKLFNIADCIYKSDAITLKETLTIKLMRSKGGVHA